MTSATRLETLVACALLAFATAAHAHVQLDAPNGGEVLSVGTVTTIRWQILIAHSLENWDLWYSTTGPTGPWIPIAMDLPPGSPAAGSMHSFDWVVPAAAVSSQCRVRVQQDNSGTDYLDASDADFEIVSPTPTCTITGPAGAGSADITLLFDSTSAGAASVDTTFEFSVDSGATWTPCTAAAGSPIPTNPATGVATGPATFAWDSRADGVGTVAAEPAVLARASVDDGVAASPGSCSTLPFAVDNPGTCTFCGDCDLSGAGPSILDSLAAAQIAAGSVFPTAEQTSCCDTNSDASINVLDALILAQEAAGLATTLSCP